MGHWFGKSNKNTSWRKTPAKINGSYYTPKGDKVNNSSAYFNAVNQNGKHWKGNTGWKDSNKKYL